MNPRISIIVPAYNAKESIQACVESLLSLEKASPTHEIIVVDNGSDDGTLDLLLQYSDIKVVKEHKIRGAAAARNAGVREAKGTVLAFTDADCVVTTGWIANVLRYFDEPGVCGVGGKIEGVAPKNEIQQWMNARKILDQEATLRHPFLPFLQTANAFFRRGDFVKLGGFDIEIPYGEDTDFCWRITVMTGQKLMLAPDALVYHDHRSTIKGLFHQSKKNAMAGAYLEKKWAGKLPKKVWKTSVWECYDIGRSLWRYARAIITLVPKERKTIALLDLIHRVGRKYGMMAAAWKTRQWHYW